MPVVVVAPIGFVSDHMEVVYDLDTEAPRPPSGSGCGSCACRRSAPTRSSSPGWSTSSLERAAQARGEQSRAAGLARGDALPSRLPPGCCPNLRAAKPACAGRTRWPAPSAADRDLAELERLAVTCAPWRRAARRRRRPADLGVAETKSTATDVVTVMDQRAQDLLRTRLHRGPAQDGFLGEEGAAPTGSSGITWVVDPIDGTVNYLYGIPSYAVSVAAVVGDPTTPGAWRPVAGAVVNP